MSNFISMKGGELVAMALGSADSEVIAKVMAEIQRRKTNREAKVASYKASGKDPVGQIKMVEGLVGKLAQIAAHAAALVEANEPIEPVMAFTQVAPRTNFAKMKKADLVAILEALQAS